MTKRRIHIVLSFLLLFSTTEYLWSQQLFGQEDYVEIQEKESFEDSELKERETENKEESRFHGLNPGYHSLSLSSSPQFGKLHNEEQPSALLCAANQRLFILFHQLKISS